MRFSTLLASLFLLLSTSFAMAEEVKPFAGEAEAGAVVVSGNTKSESYAARGKLTYTHDKNIYSGYGRYIETTANGVKSAKNWELGARYERALTDYLSVFAGQKAESDYFAGYVQRDSTDIGAKYYFIKEDNRTWTGEAGYRYMKTLAITGDETFDNLGRLYTEYNQKLRDGLSFRYWAEYLPNFTEQDAYLANTEASINVMLNSVFSLKFAYLLQYQNVPPITGERTDTTTTMTLVAKF